MKSDLQSPSPKTILPRFSDFLKTACRCGSIEIAMGAYPEFQEEKLIPTFQVEIATFDRVSNIRAAIYCREAIEWLKSNKFHATERYRFPKPNFSIATLRKFADSLGDDQSNHNPADLAPIKSTWPGLTAIVEFFKLKTAGVDIASLRGYFQSLIMEARSRNDSPFFTDDMKLLRYVNLDATE